MGIAPLNPSYGTPTMFPVDFDFTSNPYFGLEGYVTGTLNARIHLFSDSKCLRNGIDSSGDVTQAVQAMCSHLAAPCVSS